MILFAAASIAEQVKTDYDRGADFSQLQNVFVGKGSNTRPLWVDRIKAAVNAALSAKGLTPVESGGDVSVMALEMTQNDRTLNTYYDNFAGCWRWGGGFGDSTTTVDNYKAGTLAVDLFDTNTKKTRVTWFGERHSLG